MTINLIRRIVLVIIKAPIVPKLRLWGIAQRVNRTESYMDILIAQMPQTHHRWPATRNLYTLIPKPWPLNTLIPKPLNPKHLNPKHLNP